MILLALNHYYQRLLARGEEGLAPFGYSPEKISYEILLAPDGRVVGVNDIRDNTGKKPMPRLMNVPQPEKRTVGIKSNFLWDKTSYVLGVSSASKRADKEHEAFKALHQQALGGTQDAGLKALLAFLADWVPERFAQFPFKEDMLDTNMVFRLDGEQAYLHERPAAQSIRAQLLAGDEGGEVAQASCLVTGEHLPVARLHPAIKGVSGAQSSGASIVSFNLESFTSYGKSQGENAPVSEQAAFAYTTVLNHLLRRSEHNRQRLQIGDTSVVFWAEASSDDEATAAEDWMADVWAWDDGPTDGQESQSMRQALEKLVQGKPLKDIDPRLDPATRIYVLGLAPNASRISIRFWHVDTLGALADNVAWHARDMQLEPAPWKLMPALWRLVLATAPSRDGRAKSEDVPPQLAGELMRSILNGTRYPGSLLVNTLMRMRTDGDLSGVRVAICKAVLSRQRRLGKKSDDKEVPVSLDLNNTDPGYLLGRLFRCFERAQDEALSDVNAGIKSKYYGSASATPSLVFSVIGRGFQNHLEKLKKGDERKKAIAAAIEREVMEIFDKLPPKYPAHLAIEAQGQFAIGYYHQLKHRPNKAAKDQEYNANTVTDNPEGDTE